MDKLKLFLFALVVTSSSPAAFPPPKGIVQVTAPMPGFMFKPNDNLPHPAILLLHGSEGGNGDYWFNSTDIGIKAPMPHYAQDLAARGYITYALCYFDCRKQPGYKSYPPDELANVDLIDITYRAVAWLKNSPLVKDKDVTVIGFSRGAEQVLLFESILSTLKMANPSLLLPTRIIAASPYQTTMTGIPLWWAQQAKKTGKLPPQNFNVPAWKASGVPIMGGHPINIAQTKMPTLIIGFLKDSVWGSTASIEPFKKQFPYNKEFSLNMSLGDKASAKIATLPTRFPIASFVEFQNSGHSFPTDSEQWILYQKVVSRFIQQK